MGATEIVVQDAGGPRSFRGELISDLSWDNETARDACRGKGEGTRWTDMTLYRAFDRGLPGVAYVLHTVGRSLVYHQHGSECRRGVRFRVDILGKTDRYDELEPCPRCRPAPLDEIDDEKYVAVEIDRPKIYKCRNGAQVLESLKDSYTGVISGLGQGLLEDAAMKDEGIQRAITVTRPL